MSSTSPATTGLANVQRVMIVNGNAEMLRSLEPALEQGHCDIVVVESIEYAYSHIRREQPSLVILCVRLDRAPEFQLLSMLKLDRATRAIPVLTYAVDYDKAQGEEDAPDTSDAEIFAPVAAPQMN